MPLSARYRNMLIITLFSCCVCKCDRARLVAVVVLAEVLGLGQVARRGPKTRLQPRRRPQVERRARLVSLGVEGIACK